MTRPGRPSAGVHHRLSDAGFTLAEVLVTLTVMSVVGAVVTGGIVYTARLNKATAAVGEAQAQVSRAFQRLDADLRYAVDMRTAALPSIRAADLSLVYVVSAPEHRCHALSLVGDRLQRSQWAPGAMTRPVEVLAAGVSRTATAPPFTVAGGSPSTGEDEEGGTGTPKVAVVTLTATATGASKSGRRELKESFPAPNTLRGPVGVSLDECLT
jgi:prepilin-type N-terminal cleavage/methylation domain-containing protein